MGAETGVYRFADGHIQAVARGVARSVIAASPNFAVATVGPIGRGLPRKASLRGW
jgi:hypothetical protein